ncbi:hypothetical protein QFC20_006452 [Naganishia adeliensis]|uniref:Uncharacterized protein n=1 Tax=Naganishia adeliensis TaxID=92952 RepID=A0ACC2VBE9_9TREE|nr:hypothetical protein QFC20_006452 [Naganishia adeliensis]
MHDQQATDKVAPEGRTPSFSEKKIASLRKSIEEYEEQAKRLADVLAAQDKELERLRRLRPDHDKIPTLKQEAEKLIRDWLESQVELRVYHDQLSILTDVDTAAGVEGDESKNADTASDGSDHASGPPPSTAAFTEDSTLNPNSDVKG